MPEPGRADNRSLYLIALGASLALALLCGSIMQVELSRASRQKACEMAAWDLVWGERYDPALPAWAYSERQRSRWGLSLAAEDGPGAGGLARASAPPQEPWTPRKERRAFATPPELRSIDVPALGLSDRCISCHQFSAQSALPDPQLILADSSRPGDRAALLAALRERGDPTPGDTSAILDVSAHPGAWLSWHDPARFGCTSCHGGAGRALTLAGSGHRAYLPPPGATRANPHRDNTTLIRSTPELWASCGRCHPGDEVPGNPLLSEGRRLARWLSCAGCHDTSPNLAPQPPPVGREGGERAGRAGRPGPPLGRAGLRLRPEVLADYPNRAHEYAPGGRMPQYALKEAELAAIASFLRGLKAGDSESDPPLAGDAGRGAKLVEAGKCLGCHSGLAPKDSILAALDAGASTRPGPPLGNLPSRLQAGALERILADPAGEFPGTRMPQFSFSAQQRADLAAWIEGQLGQAAGGSKQPNAPAEEHISELEAAGAKRLLAEQGCSACHLIPGVGLPAQRPGPSLRLIGEKAREALPLEAQPGGVAEARSLYEYFTRQLDTPEIFSSTPAAMPHFALSPGQRAALAIALLAEQAPPPPEYIRAPAATQGGTDFWQWPVPPQGPGLPWLSPLERSLDPRACAQCHPRQYEEWSGSRHAQAMGPGITGQIIEWARRRPGEFYSCLRCHARLSEQLPIRRGSSAPGADAPPAGAHRPASPQPCVAGSAGGTKVDYVQNPAFQPGLASQAHGCANCHLRSHTRYGSDQPRQSYPWKQEVLSAHPLKREALLRASEFCKDCHQFEPGLETVNGGPPLENTYEEWRAWVSAAPKPQSCQGCHMPDGDHSFRGIHDAGFVRQSATVSYSAVLSGGQVLATLRLQNTNNGHHLPTYVTPKLWLQAWLSDADGRPVKGSWQDYMVGRDARAETRDGATVWRDHSDTRIPAGGEASLQYKVDPPATAASLHLEVYCAPDHFYHRAYGRWLAEDSRSKLSRFLLGQAQAESAPAASGYYLFSKTLRLKALEQVDGN